MIRENVTDQYHRPMRDLRISVTDRCNFRCTYCMPKELFGDDFASLPQEELLTFDEIRRLVKLFVSMGVRKIRLTGGEPLVRSGLPDLVASLASIEGVEDIGLTTNGLLLGRQAQPLYQAGLRRLNVSLDALEPERFASINGRGIKPAVILKNIELAQSLGFHLKVNMVVQKGVNDSEILPMAAYFKGKGIPLRFIEFMDAGNGNGWSFSRVVTKQEIYERLSRVYDLEPVEPGYFGEVAAKYRYRDGGAEVGFISSVSESFCSSCTRARLSSDGKMYTCLFASEGFDLRGMLRSGVQEELLSSAIRRIWEMRVDRYSDERTEQTVLRKKIPMSYIGG
ncbi:GTP 3',8-cyclase MoaA [Paenibacillus physcomitrellae]|uniref:GTP 3',8-cyclase n=1 Tax=Paenibacillus physcomitrellae TaxID=1619311 RepID=A0ABQ1FUR3_9BACL|nr:GTP 3',8-cyclase MoaA [Paenibacillus physcomitrellae]GGA30222.1 cyclic pyranopterin monophosphate synthase [Paenibacillus physcomitrellae]